MLKISEIFYSLQGEGKRAGEPSIFIRTQGCKAKHACYASGVKCDTEFESGKEYSKEDLAIYISKFNCKSIVWTGGEPTDQLTEEIISYFNDLGFYQCIETSGLNPVPKGIDFITLSPKVAEHVLEKNFPDGVTEIKYVRHQGQQIPNTKIKAHFYFISPHSDGFTINKENLKHCINLCLNNPNWNLSVQQHKLWNIL
jgi:organic radical activating enzyme